MPIPRKRVLLEPIEPLPKELTTSRRFAIQDHIDEVLLQGNPNMSQAERDFIIKYEMKYWRGYEKTINEKKHKRD